MDALPSPTDPVTLFYSYAHEDEVLREELQGHLKILERRGLVAPWHDRQIIPGEDWSSAIDESLQRAELVLLLLSKDFIQSDYIMGVELQAAMARHAQGSCVVVPIAVRAVDLDNDDAEALPFLKLQGLPTDFRPVTSWPNRDEAWTNVAKGLRAAIKRIRDSRPSLLSQPSRDNWVGGVRNSDPLLNRILEDFAAKLEVAEQLRGGASFDAEAKSNVIGDAQALVELKAQKRVLWADDHPEGNRAERALLAKLQVEVLTVVSTKDALDVLVKDAEGFDLVISDWDRPADGPNAGVSFLHALHGLPDTIRKPPLIFYHGEHRDSARKLRRVKALAAGAYGEAILPSELIALTMQSLAGYPSEDSAKKV